MIAVAALLVLQAASAVPPPLPQMAADCAQTVYASDKLVCDDLELRALDKEVANLSAGASASDRLEAAEAELRETQIAWFVRSRRCAFSTLQRRCLVDAYTERLTVLRIMPPTFPPAGTCGGGANLFLTRWGGMIEHGAKTVVGMRRTPNWQPFVSFERSGRNVRFVALDGGVIARCKILGDVTR